MNLLFIFGSFLVPLAGIALGFFLARNPERVIKLQQAFYLGINWRMEPVSLAKEIRNTRRIGVFLTIISISVLAYSFARRIFVFLP